MGAIAGVFERQGAQVDVTWLHTQSALLAHRGPSHAAVHAGNTVGYVHRGDDIRPSVCPSGQPYRRARYSILMSGRIFNARQLAAELAASNIYADSDAIAPVLLEAWIAWGDAAFRRCNGGFACAIWDEQAQQLTLARDQCGIKGLYFSVSDGRVIFASEAKAVLVDPHD